MRNNNRNYRYVDLSTMLLSLADLTHSCGERKVLALRILQIIRPYLSKQEYKRIREEIEEDYKVCTQVFGR